MLNDISSPRACITGIGAIAPFAGGWSQIAAEVAKGIPTYDLWGDELNPPFYGARLGIAKGFPKERYFTDRQLRLMDKAMSLSSVAAAFAFEDAGILGEGDIAERDEIATILASAQGEAASLFRFGSPLFQAKPGGVNPANFPMIARNVACGQLAIRFGLRGWSTMIASGDAAGAHALARAAEMIATGRAHTVLVGAYEVLSQLTLHQWKIRRGKQAAAGTSLDLEANDWVPVEGACFFVVESEQHAAQRGRKPYSIIEHCAHGYSHGADGQGWPALVDRYLSKHPSPDYGSDAMHVSCVSSSDGTAPHQHAADAFGSTIAQMCHTGEEVRTRPLFGDARSVNALYGVAFGSQRLSSEAQRGVGKTLVTSLTEQGSYALFSLTAA
jgi:hypothetical protein